MQPSTNIELVGATSTELSKEALTVPENEKKAKETKIMQVL